MPDAFICDPSARSFLKCIKGHGEYYGCERYMQKGKYYRSRIIFDKTEAHLRNDAHFVDHFDPRHQTATSPLLELSIGLVTYFVLDYMHLVCLEVMRKMINLWVPSRGSGILSVPIIFFL